MSTSSFSLVYLHARVTPHTDSSFQLGTSTSTSLQPHPTPTKHYKSSKNHIQELVLVISNPSSPLITLGFLQFSHNIKMPTQQTHLAIAAPSPMTPSRRLSPLLTSPTAFDREVCLSLDAKNKPYAFIPRMYENDYAPPAPPPPSPVNFPSESWSTALRR